MKESGEPKSSRQIAEAIGADITRVCHTIQRLLKEKLPEVKFVEVDRNKAAELLGPDVCRRTRFFYFETIVLSEEFRVFQV